MSAPERMSGLLSPVLTPFDAELKPDAARLAAHCRWLVGQGCGLAPFGTTSEGNSLTVGEKVVLLEALVAAGIDPARMMPGTGATALTDAVELTRRAVDLGCAGVLMLPPFYYKNVSDDGLYAAYSEIIQRVGDDRLRVYLYHIPPMSQTPLSLALVERLVAAYPDTVVGLKDSSGDWDNTKALLEAGLDDFRIFPGSETFLLAAMRLGGAGSISATANVNPAAILDLYDTWDADGAEEKQAAVDAIRAIFVEYAAIPALKACVAHFAGDPGWTRLRPPLVELTAEQAKATIDALDAAGFTMPGLATAEAAE